MTIFVTDTHLENLAKAMNNETYTYPAYVAVSTSDTDISATDTTLSQEQGTRDVFLADRDVETVSLSAIRSGTQVTQYGGETLVSGAAFSASSSGDMHFVFTVPSITQTTNFDIQFDFDVTYSRQ